MLLLVVEPLQLQRLPLSADVDAGVVQTQTLTIQRMVIGKLVKDHYGDPADIRTAVTTVRANRQAYLTRIGDHELTSYGDWMFLAFVVTLSEARTCGLPRTLIRHNRRAISSCSELGRPIGEARCMVDSVSKMHTSPTSYRCE